MEEGGVFQEEAGKKMGFQVLLPVGVVVELFVTSWTLERLPAPVGAGMLLRI